MYVPITYHSRAQRLTVLLETNIVKYEILTHEPASAYPTGDYEIEQ
jgi:hypothetical protein